MGKLLSLNKTFTWLDRFNFVYVFIIWVGIIILFGLVYYFFISNSSFLYSDLDKQPVKGLVDTVYFSFITATSTGFGDIVPLGAYKIVSIFEVIFGLLLLAFVTSKLVSLKQDVILNEVYEISFNERLNRLRSSLLLFRQNLNKMITKIEDNTIRKKEIDEVYIYFSSFEEVLKEISTLLNKKGGNYFTKIIDSMNAELIFNSVTTSFKKLNELFILLNEKQLDWRRDQTLSLINRCLFLDKELFEKLEASKLLEEQKLCDLKIGHAKLIEMLKSELKLPEEKNIIGN